MNTKEQSKTIRSILEELALDSGIARDNLHTGRVDGQYERFENETKEAVDQALAEIEEVMNECKPEIPVATSWQEGIEKSAFEDAIRVYQYKLHKALGKEQL